MAWHLQTPDAASPKLLANILAECGTALKGGAAFAFASAQGVKLLAANPAFGKFLEAAEFVAVIGLDAITDTKAVDELRKLKNSHQNFKPKLFLHKTAGSLFHPKTMWLKTDNGGVIITGSGNLTTGGLQANWEALAVEKLTAPEIAAAEKAWDAWLKAHSKELFELDDPKANAKAEANRKLRIKIKKVLKAPDEETEAIEIEIEAAEHTVEQAEQELQLNPVLLAEIPRASDRWRNCRIKLMQGELPMHRSPRCGARTRNGRPCRSPAMPTPIRSPFTKPRSATRFKTQPKTFSCASCGRRPRVFDNQE